MEEVWKPIDWIEPIPHDKYSISNMGHLRNNWTGHMLHFYKTTNGKYSMQLSSSTRKDRHVVLRRYRLHDPDHGVEKLKPFVIRRPNVATVVAIAFVPIPEELIQYRNSLLVRMKDGDEGNLVYTNLEWYDPHADSRDRPKEDKKLINRTPKLHDDVVADICSIIVDNDGCLAAAMKVVKQKYPEVTYDMLQRIKYKVTYTRISDQYFEYCDGWFEPI